jgi:hypothetical protein
MDLIAVNANGTGGQAYDVRKQLQDLKIDVALFTETHLKPHVLYGSTFQAVIYRTDREDGYKGGNLVAVKKGVPHA